MTLADLSDGVGQIGILALQLATLALSRSISRRLGRVEREVQRVREAWAAKFGTPLHGGP